MHIVDEACFFTRLQATELNELNSRLEKNGRETFKEAVQRLNDRLEKDKMDQVEKAQRGGAGAASSGGSSRRAEWSTDELALLIKAVNLFPAGTNQRWEVVASFVNQHAGNSDNVVRNAKETLAKAKELQVRSPSSIVRCLCSSPDW